MWERKAWLQICFCVFVSYRYDAKVNLIEGRCPGSKAMDFDNAIPRVTVPNVNIGDCDYTIAFWMRPLVPYAVVVISGLSKSGKRLALGTNGMAVNYCREVSTATPMFLCEDVFSDVVMNNWTHIAVTCEQDNRVKIFSNGEIANITYRRNVSDQDVLLSFETFPPKEMFVIHYYFSTVIMDLHILGFALPPDEIYDLYKGKKIVYFMKRLNTLYYEMITCK